MSHILNQYFDKIVCINLLERKDKKEFIEQRFNKLGIEVEWYHPIKYEFIPNIVEGIVSSKKAHFNYKEQPYEVGAALSHYHVIKTALLEGVENLFVFEDDAVFHKDFNKLIPKYIDAIPQDWNCLLLYSFMYNLDPKNIRVNARWMKAKNSWSLLAYSMNRAMMEEYINRQNQFFTISDMVTYKMQENSNMNIYCSTPCLVLPSKELTSNIRTVKNYETNPTILQLGINNDNYE